MTRDEARKVLLDRPQEAREAIDAFNRVAGGVFFTREEQELLVALALTADRDEAGIDYPQEEA